MFPVIFSQGEGSQYTRISQDILARNVKPIYSGTLSVRMVKHEFLKILSPEKQGTSISPDTSSTNAGMGTSMFFPGGKAVFQEG
jgi:hypothetical protein